MLYYLYRYQHNNYRFFVFFFNDTATTEIYTLSLHDALPIFPKTVKRVAVLDRTKEPGSLGEPLLLDVKSLFYGKENAPRSEEHTSELQSRQYLVCRLLLEKKKKH